MEYLNHFDQRLLVFNRLTLLLSLEDPFLVCFFFWGGGGEGLLDATAKKIEIKMEQFEKIINGKIMYVNNDR